MTSFARTPALPLRLLTALLIALFFLAIGQSAAMLPTLGARGTLVDFDAFYMVGQMVLEGRAPQAHDMAVMAEIQRALVGHQGFMPWTYPPQFDLLVGALPLLPRGTAFVLFTGLTLGLYLLILARLAEGRLLAVLIALAPPIYVTATIGQNAFLIGALMGGFCLASRSGRSWAGLPLGLLVIKPHLGAGLGIHALAQGRWRIFLIALVLALVLSVVATLALGIAVWPAFLAGVDQARAALATEFYPLFRMTSLYAALHTLGVAPPVALAVQVAVGLAASGAIVVAVRRGLPVHRTLALACFASLLVSPYLYDYDMTILGVGLALILGDLEARTSWLERLLMLALIWVAGGWGMIHALASAGLPWEERAANARATLSYGAFAYLLVLALLARVLQRPASR